MAIAYDASSRKGTDWLSGASITWAHSCSGSDRLLCVGVVSNASGGGDRVSGVTYGGVAMTQGKKTVITGDTDTIVYLYYLINPASGANNIVVSFSPNAQNANAFAVSYTGCHQTSQPDNNGGASGTGTSLSCSTTVNTADSWLVTMVCNRVAQDVSAGTGTTKRTGAFDDTSSEAGILDSNGALATGTRSLVITASSLNAGMAMLAIKVAESTVAPTVTTQAVSDVTTTSATGNGNITATGGANATRRGFCYMTGTSGDPTTANSVAYDDGDFGTGAFTKGLTGLSSATAYRVRAYAVNSAGTSYGSTVDLTTKSLYTVTCATGTFVLTGYTVAIKQIRKVICATGTFTLTGFATMIKQIRKIMADVGSFIFTGYDATITYIPLIPRITCETGSFVLTGSDALIKQIRHVTCGSGSFALTGYDAIINSIHKIFCSTGTFVLTGYDAIINSIHKIFCSTGTFVLTGYSATIKCFYKIVCASGSFILTGFSINFRGFGDWIWSRRSRPSTSWSGRTKPTTPWSGRTKPSTTWRPRR